MRNLNDHKLTRLIIPLFLQALLLHPSAFAEPGFTSVNPAIGGVGTVFEIKSENLDVNLTYTVTLGGGAAEVLNVAPDGLTVAVTEASASGKITVSDGMETVTLVQPFIVSRTIPGIFSPGSLVDLEGYQVTTGDSFAAVDPGTGEFSLAVPVDRHTVAWAFRDRGDPAFLAAVLPGDSGITLNPDSTAVGLALLNPEFIPLGTADIQGLRDYLEGRGETASLAGLIESIAGDNVDYVADERVQDALVALSIEAIDFITTQGTPIVTMNPPFAASSSGGVPQTLAIEDSFKSGTPEGTFLREINPPEPGGPLTMRHRYDHKLSGADQPDFLTFSVEFKSGIRSPLDAIIDIYKVDPLSLPDGLESIAFLDPRDSLVLLSDEPVASGFITGSPLAGEFDLTGRAFGAFYNAVAGTVVPTDKPNEFKIRNNIPAVYLAQVFTGNTHWMDTVGGPASGSQIGVIRDNDRKLSWALANASNNITASVDWISASGAKVFDAVLDGFYLDGLLKSYVKAAAIYGLDEAGMSEDEIINISKTLIGSLGKAAAEKAFTGAEKALAERYFLKRVDLFSKSLSGFGQASDAGQASERTFAILSPLYLAMERSVFVIGDPFDPVITRFNPPEGVEEDTVVIFGRNFIKNAIDPVVSFCTLNMDGPVPTIEEEIFADVVSSSNTQITVNVPEGWEGVIPSNEAFICVDANGRRAFSSETFSRVTAPEITAVTPGTVSAGDVLTITGSGFRPDTRLFLDPDSANSSRIEAPSPFVNETTLEFKVLGTGRMPAIDYTVTASNLGKTSAPGMLTVERNIIPPEALEPGQTLTVNQGDFLDVPDDKLSYLEAMQLASGTNVRSFEPEFGSLALDNDGDGKIDLSVGTEFANKIQINNAIAGGAVSTGGAAFPPVESGSDFDFEGVTFDCGGADTPLPVTGNGNINITNITLTNQSGAGVVVNMLNNGFLQGINVISPGGDGIVISGGSEDILLNNCEVTSPGGTGVVLNGLSKSNINFNTVTGAGGHGFHLTDVRDTRFRTNTISGGTGSGILMEGASAANVFDNINGNPGNTVTGNGVHGLHLSGAGVTGNVFARSRDFSINFDTVQWLPKDFYDDNGGYGILIEDGASSNIIAPESVSGNALGGIRITADMENPDSTNFALRNQVGARPLDNLGPAAALSSTVTEINDNLGHGVHVGPGAPDTEIIGVTIDGALGSGIRVDGPDVQDGVVGWAKIGLTPNSISGHGIHLAGAASDWSIGQPEIQNAALKNFISNTAGNGIFLDGAGVTRTRIINTNIGNLDSPLADAGVVGMNGIAIRGGSHDNTIGGPLPVDRQNVRISSTNDAGIWIEGENTENNLVKSVLIEGQLFGAAEGNLSGEVDTRLRIGIEIANGARNNRIGVPGLIEEPLAAVSLGGFPQRSVTIGGVTDTGLLIDNAGGFVNGDNELETPNIIRNSSINGVIGLMLRNNAMGNIIGDIVRDDANQINGAERGVVIRDVVIGNEFERNRFEGNIIRSTGTTNRGATADLTAGPPPDGIAVLIDGDSQGNRFGEHSGSGNLIGESRVGVYLNGVSGTHLRGLEITKGFVFGAWEIAAGVVVNGGGLHKIGGEAPEERLEITNVGNAGDSGELNPNTGGIVLINTEDNEVKFNRIDNGMGDGMILIDSANNLIGGGTAGFGNVITGNEGHGMRIEGGLSTENRIQFNRIGTNRNLDVLGNGGDGVHIRNGAHGNLLGGFFLTNADGSRIRLSAPNDVRFNDGAGVRIVGGSTTGNQIVNNAITNNVGPGIALEGGNSELPPPDGAFYDGRDVFGSVPNGVPDGSLVQVFTDTVDEGEVFLGESLVQGSAWRLPAIPDPVVRQVTATVTNMATGDTSPFTTVELLDPRVVTLERTGGQTAVNQNINLPTGENTVLPLTVASPLGDLLISGITLQAAGGLAENGGLDESGLTGVKIYRDNNKNAAVDPGDTLIGGPANFEFDDGTASITLNGASLRSGIPEQWLVVYDVAQAPPEGTTFSLRITDENNIEASYLFPAGAPVEYESTFPVSSNLFVVVLGDDGSMTVIPIADPQLKTALLAAAGKSGGELTRADILSLTELIAEHAGITSLDGLENAVNLQVLDLGATDTNNAVTELAPLSSMTALQELDLGGNGLSELGSLSGLTNLRVLLLYNNRIVDLSPLGGLTNLAELDLLDNRVSNIGPLSTLEALGILHLGSNDVEDLSPLSGLSNLEFLNLAANEVSTVDPLGGLTQLRQLRLQQNRIENINTLGALASLRDDFIFEGAGLDLRFNRLNLEPGSDALSVIDTLNSIEGLNVLSGGQISPDFNVTNFINDARDLDDGWFSSRWFGIFNANLGNWIFHNVHGWMYLYDGENTSGGLWLFHGPYRWLWTRAELEGWFYSPNRETFVFFSENDMGERFLYDFSLKAWESAPRLE